MFLCWKCMRNSIAELRLKESVYSWHQCSVATIEARTSFSVSSLILWKIILKLLKKVADNYNDDSLMRTYKLDWMLGPSYVEEICKITHSFIKRSMLLPLHRHPISDDFLKRKTPNLNLFWNGNHKEDSFKPQKAFYLIEVQGPKFDKIKFFILFRFFYNITSKLFCFNRIMIQFTHNFLSLKLRISSPVTQNRV